MQKNLGTLIFVFKLLLLVTARLSDDWIWEEKGEGVLLLILDANSL